LVEVSNEGSGHQLVFALVTFEREAAAPARSDGTGRDEGLSSLLGVGLASDGDLHLGDSINLSLERLRELELHRVMSVGAQGTELSNRLG